MADGMHCHAVLLSENRLIEFQIFGWFGFLKTESEPNFGFPHIPSTNAGGVDKFCDFQPVSGPYVGNDTR